MPRAGAAGWQEKAGVVCLSGQRAGVGHAMQRPKQHAAKQRQTGFEQIAVSVMTDLPGSVNLFVESFTLMLFSSSYE